ncbi:MAG: ribonuclease Z [Flavobacteriales bacterium]|nr:ribonuclease Z [Flavobacteriales bacterium]
MRFDVTILGSNSAIPALQRNPTCQLVNVSDQYYLLDCGEGAQVQMRKYGVKFQRISCIFVSHLHGDHYFGLIGLLNTMHLLGRKKEISIFSPPGLQEIIELQLRSAHGSLRFEINFHTIELDELHQIHEDKYIKVHAVPVQHKITTFGYVIEEKPKVGNIKKGFIEKYKPSVESILKIKDGFDFYDTSGTLVPRMQIIAEPTPIRKYAFITDTKPSASYFEAIRNVNLLYHEATFTQENKKRATETKHSTAQQAAEVALKVGAKKLIIGHFSSRYTHLGPILEEAKKYFENTELAEEGRVFKVE